MHLVFKHESHACNALALPSLCSRCNIPHLRWEQSLAGCVNDTTCADAVAVVRVCVRVDPPVSVLLSPLTCLSSGSAIVDATECINIEPSYIKGYYRRGTAYLALGKLKQAKADFREAVKIDPGNYSNVF